MTEKLWLVEAVAYDPAISGTKTLRWCSGQGFVTGASETPAHTAYEPRIIEPSNLSRTAFSDARVMGGASVGYGEVVLNNADQGLVGLLDLGMDGRDLIVRVGEKGAAYPGGFTTFLTGTVEQVEVGPTRATIRLRDKLAVLQQPIQANKYGGTNVLPAGVDGVEDDLEGKPKPLLYGYGLNFTPPCVNTARLIYQLHDGQISAVTGVWDSGAPLTFGTDRANTAAMEATAPAAGSYDTCLATGLIRLGATPTGVLTVSARGSAAGGYVSTVGDIVKRILTTHCGVSAGDVDATALAALNSAAPYEVGVWVGIEETTRQAVIDQVLQSVGAWLAPDRAGAWKLAQLVAPTGTAATTLTDLHLLSLERQATSDPGRGVPVYRATVRYKRYWTVQAEDSLAGSVTADLRAELSQEWRTKTATDAAVQTKHLLATELVRDTLLTTGSDASSEASRLLALHKVRRDFCRAVIALDATNAALDLGSIVTVQTARAGYSAGRKFVVVGVSAEGARNRLTLDLWG